MPSLSIDLDGLRHSRAFKTSQSKIGVEYEKSEGNKKKGRTLGKDYKIITISFNKHLQAIIKIKRAQ
jgi:hypothetical protein